MLEKLLSKKYIKKILFFGTIIFLSLTGISFFSYRPLNLFNIYNAFKTAAGAFTGTHGETLEILIENRDIYTYYKIMFVLYVIFSIFAVLFSLYMVADLFGMLFLKSKEGIKKFDENTYLIFGFNNDVYTMIENTTGVEKKNIHIVSLNEFSDEELKKIDKLGVSYDYLDGDNLNKCLKTKKYHKVKNLLLAENKNMANYFIYNKLLSVERSNDSLRVSCLPISDTERIAIENSGEKFVNMVGLKQVIAETVSESLSEILCNNINYYKNKNIKCLMIGFGETGQNVFKMIVNQLVIDSKNGITIDIVDKAAAFVFKKAMQNVSCEYKDDNGLSIENPVADGVLDVNIFNFSYNDDRCIGLMADNNYDFVVLNILNDYQYIDFVENNRKLIGALPKTKFIVPVLQFDEYCNTINYSKINGDVEELVNLHISKVYEKYNLKILEKNIAEENAIIFNFHYNEILGFAYGDKDKMWIDSDYYSKKSSVFQSLHQNINDSLRKQNPEQCRIECEKLKGVTDPDEIERIINSNAMLREIAMTEHRRWTYFMILDGWKSNPTKNKKLKHSDCIMNWDLLCKKKKDVLIYDLTPLFVLVQNKETSLCQNQI